MTSNSESSSNTNDLDAHTIADTDLCGRYTAFLDFIQTTTPPPGVLSAIAVTADAFGVELAGHGGGPTNMNIICRIPNAIYMESGGKQKMVDGEVPAPEAPGMSSEPAADFIARHKVA
jgi:hypothetical protein